MTRPDAILIAGPTASGKSTLASTFAARIGGHVINADAMQVYRDLRIITARPSPEEEAAVPHRLYGHVDAAVNYSVGHYLRDAGAALDEARQLQRVPILVGGTGLYFKALTCGLAAVPAIPDVVRNRLRDALAARGPEILHAELGRRDPAAAARLNRRDGIRIVRALEVIEATGRSLADWQRDSAAPLLDPSRAIKLFLAPDRAVLYARIDARFVQMLAAGAIAEVSKLAARELDPLLPLMKAHGVPWLIRYLQGEMALADAAAQAQADTRHYAKRQFTWFRHQLADWPQVAPENASIWLQDAIAEVAKASPLHHAAHGLPPPFHGGG